VEGVLPVAIHSKWPVLQQHRHFNNSLAFEENGYLKTFLKDKREFNLNGSA